MNNPSKCAILMPVSRYIEPATEASIIELSRMGYSVLTQYDCSAVDYARCRLASRAMKEGFDEIMWIDSDISFHPNAVERLRSHDLPITCGLYSRKLKKGGIAAKIIFNNEPTLSLGIGGEIIEVQWVGLGFFYAKRIVYEDVKRTFDLKEGKPIEDGIPTVPYFMPSQIIDDDGQYFYLTEDTSFCHKVRQCGYKIYADTTIRLGHIGNYTYSFEDMLGDRERYTSLKLGFKND